MSCSTSFKVHGFGKDWLCAQARFSTHLARNSMTFPASQVRCGQGSSGQGNMDRNGKPYAKPEHITSSHP